MTIIIFIYFFLISCIKTLIFITINKISKKMPYTLCILILYTFYVHKKQYINDCILLYICIFKVILGLEYF